MTSKQRGLFSVDSPKIGSFSVGRCDLVSMTAENNFSQCGEIYIPYCL